jgi:hypothetical protein
MKPTDPAAGSASTVGPVAASAVVPGRRPDGLTAALAGTCLVVCAVWVAVLMAGGIDDLGRLGGGLILGSLAVAVILPAVTGSMPARSCLGRAAGAFVAAAHTRAALLAASSVFGATMMGTMLVDFWSFERSRASRPGGWLLTLGGLALLAVVSLLALIRAGGALRGRPRVVLSTAGVLVVDVLGSRAAPWQAFGSEEHHRFRMAITR